MSVCPSIHLSIRHISMGSEGKLKGFDSQLVGSEGLSEGCEGQLKEFEGQF